MIIAPDVLAVLDRAVIDGPSVVLTGHLDRKLYERTNKALEAAGGKWNRKARAHVFDGDAAEALEPIFLTGSITITSAKQEFGAFYTPPDIASRVIETAALEPGMTVLEPSAGRGALSAPALLAGCLVDCIEIDPRSVQILASTPYRQVVERDFLQQEPTPTYDRVVMNPPFSRGQDCAHVLHALKFLRPGGRLVSIMASSVLFRTSSAFDQVRTAARNRGSIEPLPEGAFKPSGTSVNTVLVTIESEWRREARV